MSSHSNAVGLALPPLACLRAKILRARILRAKILRTKVRWGMWFPVKWLQEALYMLLGILLLALPSAAQVEVGDAKMNLSGDIGFNYNSNINDGSSSHSFSLSGDANLTGSYYDPRFLNFAVRPYYNHSQSNSESGSLVDTSGVNASANLFSGSHFPGSFYYGKADNSTGAFGVPGSSIGLATNGNSDAFGVTWSALLPNLPTLMASYSIDSDSSSVYGTDQTTQQTDHNLTFRSGYTLAGFRMAGAFIHRTVDGTFSELLEGVSTPVKSDDSNNNYQFNASHSFPMGGSFSISANRDSYDYSSHDGSTNTGSGASNMLNGNLNFRPTIKLSVGASASYTDSLLGSIPEQVLNSGTETQVIVNLGSFKSFQLEGDSNYQLLKRLTLRAAVIHTGEEFLGQSYGSTQFAGSAYYNMEHSLIGHLSFNFTMFDTANQDGNQGLGFTGNLNFNRRLAAWDVDANFSYSQGVQTINVLQTSSTYSWVANVRRRVGMNSHLSFGYSGSRSGLSEEKDYSSSLERFSGTFSFRRYSANGYWSKSNGTALFTPAGLVALPPNVPPSLLPPGSLILYSAKSYGASLSASPISHLNVSAGYSKSNGNTLDPAMATYTETELYNGILQYRLRKIWVNAGFTRLNQSINTVSTGPITVTSYYVGISRWFNFF